LDLQTATIEWRRLFPNTQSYANPKQLTDEIASFFLSTITPTGQADLRPINLLCKLSESSNPELAESATESLYNTIIEKLCDDFSTQGINAANQVLVRMLFNVRDTKRGEQLKQLLATLGICHQSNLLDRYERLRHPTPIGIAQRCKVRKIILLSRVTIGADVVILGVLTRRLREAFPAAELVLIGPAHLEEILHGLPTTRFHCFEYRRFGAMPDKICVWPLIYDIVQDERSGYLNDELLLFDPDTRLTQLGLLPLIEEVSTYYFDSRREPGNGNESSLAVLVNQWLDIILPGTFFCNPTLLFKDETLQAAQTFIAGLPASSLLIIINLGVGRNENKRIPEPFETELLLSLLTRKDTLILLDSGSAAESLMRVKRLLATVQQRSVPTEFFSEKELSTKTIPFNHGVVGFKGSIGSIGALISKAHGFIGYDSSCQHIAAAVGTPSVIAFAGAPNQRFQERWRPFSPAGTSQTFMIENIAALDPEAIHLLAQQMTVDLHALIKKTGELRK